MDPVSSDVNHGINPFWGKVISVYSRERAIEDGVLVDVSATAREAGLKWPTVVTQGVWSEVVVPRGKAKEHGESESGRLWDTLWTLVCAIRAKARNPNGRNEPEDTVYYSVIATDETGEKKPVHKLWAKVTGEGPGGAPVLTIMLIGED